MSNQQVGAVYQQIIADVVESSRVDFEEGGVDDHVLEELRLVRAIAFLRILSFTFIYSHLRNSIKLSKYFLSSRSTVESCCWGVGEFSFCCDLGPAAWSEQLQSPEFSWWATRCIWLYTQPSLGKIMTARGRPLMIIIITST